MHPPCGGSTTGLILAAVRAGGRLELEGEALRVSGPKEAKALGAEIIAHKAAVLDFLTRWDTPPRSR